MAATTALHMLISQLCQVFDTYGATEVVKRLEVKNMFFKRETVAAAHYLQLIEEEVNCRLLDNDKGDTILIKAIRAHDISNFLFLLNMGADPNKSNLYLHSPIEVANELGHIDVVVQLIRAGADYRPILMHLTLLPVIYKHCPSKLEFLGRIQQTSEYSTYLRDYNNEKSVDIKSPTYECKPSMTFIRPYIRLRSQQFSMEVKHQIKIDSKSSPLCSREQQNGEQRGGTALQVAEEKRCSGP